MSFRIIFCSFVLLVSFSVSACAGQAHNTEQVISSFLGEMSKCKVNVSIEKSILVSDTGNDYSAMVPKILAGDTQVIVSTKISKVNDKYYFWLREDGDSYKVISYTSFSQPE